jgi:RNA polymerase sigma factor (sigma-70 family)
MVNGQLGVVLRYLRTLTGPAAGAPTTDGELLRQFVAHRDEAAFAALVERHGPMVLGVCRRLLHQPQDVDDVFQATFLVLIERAGSVARADSVGSWLYGVARRIALRVRANARKRRECEWQGADAPATGNAGAEMRELWHVLDEELCRLPEKYRAPLVLHYLSGRTKAETAQDLGWTEGTVSGRLARGRQLLRARLTRRGIALGGLLATCGLACGEAPAAVPPALRDATLQGAARFAAGAATGTAARLAREMVRGLVLTKVWTAVGLVLVLGALAGTAALVAPRRPAEPLPPDLLPEVAAAAPAAPAPKAGTDFFGDPLPAGAVARLGTTRGRHTRQLSALALSPDGKLLATRAGDDRVRLWESATGKELHVLRGEGELPGLWGFAFALDGKALVTGGADGKVRFWDPATGRQRHEVEGNAHGVRCVAFSGDGKLLAVGGEDNEVDLWDAASRKKLRRIGQAGGPLTPKQAGLAPLRDVVFCPGDKALAVLYRQPDARGLNPDLCCLELLDVDTGGSLHKIGAPLMRARRLPLTDDGKAVFWVGRSGKVYLRDVDGGRVIREFDGGSVADRLALSPDGRTLAVASERSVRLWDATAGTKGRLLEGSGRCGSLAFSRDGKTLAGGTFEGTFQLWDTATGERLLKPPTGHEGAVRAVASSPDGKTLATYCAGDGAAGGDGGAIRLWQASTGKEIRRWQTPAGQYDASRPTSLAYSPDGKALAAAWDGTVRVWDAGTGKEVRRFSGRQGARPGQSHLRFAPDGKLLATRDSDGAIRLWTSAGEERLTLQGAGLREWDAIGVRALAFSPDGRLLAGSQGADVRLWEVATGKELSRLTGGAPLVTALAFSPDGKSLATAGNGDAVSVWEVATGRERRRLVGRTSAAWLLDPEGYRNPDIAAAYFNALEFAPDGQTLLGGRGDGGVYVWDVTADRPAHKVYGHKEAVTCLAVSGDGKTVASASADRTVLVWDLAALRQALRDRDKGE